MSKSHKKGNVASLNRTMSFPVSDAMCVSMCRIGSFEMLHTYSTANAHTAIYSFSNWLWIMPIYSNVPPWWKNKMVAVIRDEI